MLIRRDERKLVQTGPWRHSDSLTGKRLGYIKKYRVENYYWVCLFNLSSLI